jgi:hypothetical protein
MNTKTFTAGILAAALMGAYGVAQANNTAMDTTAKSSAQANAPTCTDKANTMPAGCVAAKTAKGTTAMGADQSASGHNPKGSLKGKVDSSVTDGNTNSAISSDSSVSTTGANGKDSH